MSDSDSASGNAGRLDPLQQLVNEVAGELLRAGNTLVPLDVLIRLELVEIEAVEAWRNGELPYLERGIRAGLARVARILRLVHEYAASRGLKPTPGRYLRRGKGRRPPLRFSKRGDAASERLYACHFVKLSEPSSNIG